MQIERDLLVKLLNVISNTEKVNLIKDLLSHKINSDFTDNIEVTISLNNSNNFIITYRNTDNAYPILTLLEKPDNLAARIDETLQDIENIYQQENIEEYIETPASDRPIYKQDEIKEQVSLAETEEELSDIFGKLSELRKFTQTKTYDELNTDTKAFILSVLEDPYKDVWIEE